MRILTLTIALSVLLLLIKVTDVAMGGYAMWSTGFIDTSYAEEGEEQAEDTEQEATEEGSGEEGDEAAEGEEPQAAAG